MDIAKFVQVRKYLYHLTDPVNCDSILSDYKLKSLVTLADLVNLPNKQEYLKTRRIGHKQPVFSEKNYKFTPRDQDPLVLSRLILEDEMTPEDFIFFLNSRVFFWAKEKDLLVHYKRYKKLGQNPCVFRVSTEEVFTANVIPPKFCHLNSGAPSHWTRGLPARGKSTFQLADEYLKSPSSVREVTFENHCILPKNLYFTKDLKIEFKKLK